MCARHTPFDGETRLEIFRGGGETLTRLLDQLAPEQAESPFPHWRAAEREGLAALVLYFASRGCPATLGEIYPALMPLDLEGLDAALCRDDNPSEVADRAERFLNMTPIDTVRHSIYTTIKLDLIPLSIQTMRF